MKTMNVLDRVVGSLYWYC